MSEVIQALVSRSMGLRQEAEGLVGQDKKLHLWLADEFGKLAELAQYLS